MSTISIIVPLYKGKEYVNTVIEQVVRNAHRAINIHIEIIFVNDYPQDVIEVNESGIKIRVLNNEINMGIHASRVKGLRNAEGEFILFLDQDDKISDDYIQKQLSGIGDSDAIVCKLLNGGRKHYTDSFVFEKVISKEFMLNNWCSIVSPGQVVIRKDAIPQIWQNNILKSNGADDYFLWINMLIEGKRFALNYEILFEHIVSSCNTSMNNNLMMDSEIEMIEILKKQKMISESDKKSLDCLKNELRKVHIKQLETFQISYMVLDALADFNDENIQEELGRSIAIYGAGDIGMALYKGIREYVGKLFFIDRNAKYIDSQIPIYTLDENPPKDCETVIIALNGDVSDIKNELSKYYSCDILSILEVIKKWRTKNDKHYCYSI